MASNDYRNESRRTPPAPRYAEPGTAYPTPNPYDILITEAVPLRNGVYEPALYGTPHPVVAAAVLCHQSEGKGNNTDKPAIRVYANPRLAQEPYNLVNGGSEENSQSFPIFERSYLLPRGYAKGTTGTPLSSLIGLTLVSGGTGYGAGNLPSPFSGKVALSFSGGSGSGAAGFAEVVGGVVAAVRLTNTGTGYTSAPAVSIPGGSGASITALIQLQTATLTKEDETPAEEPYDGYFVRVRRTWTTLPGPIITTTRIDEDGVTVTVTHQLMAVGDIVTTEDLATGIWTRKFKGEGDAVVAQQITEARAVPGNPQPTIRFDEDSETFITVTRQLFQASTITPATPYSAGTSATKIELENYRGSNIVAYEVTTVYPDSPHNDLASAKVSDKLQPKAFPARVDVSTFALVNGVPLGLRRPQSETVLHTSLEYWVIAAIKPNIALDQILYGDTMYLPDGFSFGECIHDAATIVYPVVGAVTFPATVPSYTTYTLGSGGWINFNKVIGGGVDNAGHPHRWKCVSITVVFQ